MQQNLFNILDTVRRDAISKFDESNGITSIVEAIAMISEASMVGRKEGLLALEEKFAQGNTGTIIDEISDGFMMVVDGNDPVDVAEVLTNQYWVCNYSDNNALKQYVLIRGVLLVQQGTNPRVIEEILVSLIPRKLKEEVGALLEEERKNLYAKNEAKILSWYESWQGYTDNKLTYMNKVNEFSKLISSLDDKSIQRVLREVDNSDLELALLVLPKDITDKFLNNMSHRLKVMILDDVQNMSSFVSFYENDAELVLDKVTGIIYRLADMGDIIIIPY